LNYWFLYSADTGEIYGAPYLGLTSKWDNVPEGCVALGPIDAATASDDIKAAFINPTYYRITSGMLVKKTDAEIQAIKDAQPVAQPTASDILGQQVATLTLSNGQKNSIIQQLGAQVVQMQLDITKLKGGVS
jgi:hypothetical protein